MMRRDDESTKDLISINLVKVKKALENLHEEKEAEYTKYKINYWGRCHRQLQEKQHDRFYAMLSRDLGVAACNSMYGGD